MTAVIGGAPVTADPVDTASAIVFDEVSKTFRDGTWALDRVSFQVAPGELVAVVGASGCGKSTLLHLASGLDEPTGGAVRADVDDIGYVFQDATLLPWRSVRRNVELPSQLRRVSSAQRQEAVRAAIALTGLEGFEDHLPRQLSGGMRMRVSLARALSLRPRVFLFDEPFGALDEITRERLNDELLRLFDQERFAGLFVTHSVAEAVYLASRVVVLHRRPGRVAADVAVPFGYPRTPDLRYTAAFGELSAEVSAHLREASR